MNPYIVYGMTEDGKFSYWIGPADASRADCMNDAALWHSSAKWATALTPAEAIAILSRFREKRPDKFKSFGGEPITPERRLTPRYANINPLLEIARDRRCLEGLARDFGFSRRAITEINIHRGGLLRAARWILMANAERATAAPVEMLADAEVEALLQELLDKEAANPTR